MTEVVKSKMSIANYVKQPAIDKQIESLIGKNKGTFISNVITIANDSPQLKECDPNQLYQICLKSIALNLSLTKELGLAYVIPYKNNKTKVVVPTFQIGKNGWRQLALRSGRYKYINAETVRKGELKRNKFTMQIEESKDYPDNEIVGYLALFECHDGYKASVYMTVSQMEAHAMQYVPSFKSDVKNSTKYSLWSDPIEKHKMAEKTVLKRLIKEYGYINTEIDEAINSEEDEKFSEYEDVSTKTSRTAKDVEVSIQPEPVKEERVKL